MKLNNSIKKQDEAKTPNDIEIANEIAEEEEDISDLSLEEKIIYWKNKYKKIYKSVIGKETYIWRRINRKEYTKIAFTKHDDNVTTQEDMYNKQYEFCKIAVLYPDNIEELMDECAGISPTLGDEIIFNSGFGDIYSKTEEL